MVFVEHGAYIQRLSHRYIVDILDLGDGLANAETLGSRAGKDIRPAAVGNRHKGIGILYALLLEDRHIRSVGIDNQRMREFFRQLGAYLAVFLENLDIQVFGECQRGFARDTRPTKEDDVVYISFVLSQLLTQKIHLLAVADHIHYIARQHLVATTRDNRFAFTLDSHNTEPTVVVDTRTESLVDHRRALAHFHDA